MTKVSRSLEERFWSKVDRGGPLHATLGSRCELWTSSLTACGYGQVWDGQKMRVAHRVAWHLSRGPIPEGMQVLHKCDEGKPREDISYRRCVNPDHLFLGTHADNMADRQSKGRQARGEVLAAKMRGDRNPNYTHPHLTPRGECHTMAKLTVGQVREVFARKAAGECQASIARGMGVSSSLVSQILKRKIWKHVA